MKKIVYLLLILPFIFFSQSAENKNKAVSIIEKKFNTETISAYQNRAQNRIIDFFDNLILLQNTDNAALQQEIKTNIKLMFINQKLNFENIINTEKINPSIDDIMNEIITKSINISMIEFISNSYFNHYNFEFSYTLQVIKNNQKKQFNLLQKVFLLPVEKQFGNTKKTVWEIKLGEFIAQ